jgi:hypothetical protein
MNLASEGSGTSRTEEPSRHTDIARLVTWKKASPPAGTGGELLVYFVMCKSQLAIWRFRNFKSLSHRKNERH